PFAIASFGMGFSGTQPRAGGEALTGGTACYRTYATKDGKCVALAIVEPKFWVAFCNGAGIDVDMTALFPGEHQRAAQTTMEALFASKTRDEWAAFGAQYDCCLEPVLEPGEAAS